MHNGFGDHYMQDSYAAGHLINKTLIMQHYVQWLDKNPGKWDAHRDQNWRKMQQMAYNQPGLTDQGQYVKANVGTRTLSTGVTIGTARDPQSVENIKTGNWRTKAEALGLEVPASLNDPDARRSARPLAGEVRDPAEGPQHADPDVEDGQGLGRQRPAHERPGRPGRRSSVLFERRHRPHGQLQHERLAEGPRPQAGHRPDAARGVRPEERRQHAGGQGQHARP